MISNIISAYIVLYANEIASSDLHCTGINHWYTMRLHQSISTIDKADTHIQLLYLRRVTLKFFSNLTPLPPSSIIRKGYENKNDTTVKPIPHKQVLKSTLPIQYLKLMTQFVSISKQKCLMTYVFGFQGLLLPATSKAKFKGLLVDLS